MRGSVLRLVGSVALAGFYSTTLFAQASLLGRMAGTETNWERVVDLKVVKTAPPGNLQIFSMPKCSGPDFESSLRVAGVFRTIEPPEGIAPPQPTEFAEWRLDGRYEGADTLRVKARGYCGVRQDGEEDWWTLEAALPISVTKRVEKARAVCDGCLWCCFEFLDEDDFHVAAIPGDGVHKD